jgi:uncharacterized membrane protein
MQTQESDNIEVCSNKFQFFSLFPFFFLLFGLSMVALINAACIQSIV